MNMEKIVRYLENAYRNIALARIEQQHLTLNGKPNANKTVNGVCRKISDELADINNVPELEG